MTVGGGLEENHKIPAAPAAGGDGDALSERGQVYEPR